ncbi:MAG: DUF5123 domain-containing protein [Dysgonamonadaceae bacterium]|jgi:hypothetical protein|nr:DUF5123 domain-containing protein [Dysgonamonadaceae bacterium]
MNRFNKYIYFVILSFAIIFTACEEPGDEITSINYDRLFSPTSIETTVLNKVDLRLRWHHTENSTQYEIQIFDNGDLNFDGTPARTLTYAVDEDAVENAKNNSQLLVFELMIRGLAGQTKHSLRIKSIGNNIPDSKWTTATFQTDAEQIFQAVDPEEIQASQVVLRWPAGQTATEIVLTPGDIHHTVTAAEIAAGAATITGLTGETTYTAVLMNGTKERGRITFTTLIDLGNATGINPDDDLVAILNAAGEGAEFVLFPGTYTLGSYALTKSVKLSGYKSNDKPVIYGQLTCGAAISIELKSIIFDGTTYGQFFNTTSGCDISALTLSDCEIKNYSNNFIYNNTSGKFGSIHITDCYIHDIPGTGGDGIDFRGGTLGTLTVEKTTFANGFRTFLRMQAAANVAFRYCTFYKISCLDDGNNHGLFRLSTAGSEFEVSNCLLVGTGKVNPTAATVGNFCRQAGNMQDSNPTYNKNFYFNCGNLWVGLYTDPAQCAAAEADPGFADADNGDFHVSNIDIKGIAGDPRWW